MLRLTVIEGSPEDTVIGSTLCAACAYSPAGCCVAPPRMDWSDIARVVSHGGASWILDQIALGNLRAFDHGLSLRRVKEKVGDANSPRIQKCVFHGPRGCTIAETHRPATCNYYVCDHAIADGEKSVRGSGLEATRAHDRLVGLFAAWDAAIRERIQTEWPSGPPFDGPFLEWLHQTFVDVQRLSAAT